MKPSHRTSESNYISTPPLSKPSLTVVVILKDVSDGLDRHRVRILGAVAVVVVRRFGLRRIPVAHGEVDGHNEVKAEAAAHVIEKRRVLQRGGYSEWKIGGCLFVCMAG